MTDIEFQAWPKTPRLNRDIIITEKIDGTNACIIVNPVDEIGAELSDHYVVFRDGVYWEVAAQSRKRIITPGADNFGFARWVYDNASQLVEILGAGYHYGEWWGHGIQRGYGLPKGERRFSLFDYDRYVDLVHEEQVPRLEGLDVVPLLGRHARFDSDIIGDVLDDLSSFGSYAAPGYSNAEGVIVWHTAARQAFKVLLEGDDRPKGEVA